jgi:pimeloyl-ACP methyl ester carboxylesterase
MNMKNNPIKISNVDVQMNGTPLPVHYMESGQGDPILLLHGLGDSAYTWQWVIQPLARNYHVYAVSMPGFGASAKPEASYSPDFFVNFTDAFMDAMEIEQAVLIGNSLGGLVSMRMALDMPDRVSALILVSSAGLGREVSPALRLLTLPGFGHLVAAWNKTALGAYQWALFTTMHLFAHPVDAPKVWTSGLKQMARMPGYLEATVTTMRNIGTIMGQREQQILLNQLDALELPTLVLWGDQDKVLPVHHGRDAVSKLPRGQMTVFSRCGHLPHIEAAASFVEAVEDFL